MVKIVEEAYLYAKSKHKGSKYGDKPYICHPAFVARIIKFIDPIDYNLISAAWLHDVIEDCSVTQEQLKELFSEDIAGLVWEVTKTGKDEFKNLKTKRGHMLKLADWLANLYHSTSEEHQHKYMNICRLEKNE